MKPLHSELLLALLPRPRPRHLSPQHIACFRTRPRRAPQSRSLHRNTTKSQARQPLRIQRGFFASVEAAEDDESSRTRRLLNKEDLPSPEIFEAARSSKLAALHARLALPPSFPVQILARCLVHSTADPDPDFNNASLAVLGADILGFLTAEHVIAHYPRLPMSIIFAAQNAYVGPKTLAAMVREWGVEAVAAPGGEVDPGLLQFRRKPPGKEVYGEREDLFEGDTSRVKLDDASAWRAGVRRGMGARIVGNDQFGDFGSLWKRDWEDAADDGIQMAVDDEVEEPEGSKPGTSWANWVPWKSAGPATATDSPPKSQKELGTRPTADLEVARATFFRALVGAITLQNGMPSATHFHAQHVLSRHLDLTSLFLFKFPTRDLSRLCAREGFESPVARLLSETGRHSIAPVFVVGVYSGVDKLGEGAGSSLDEARYRAAANALRGWYLYRPLEVTKPSEAEAAGKKWIPNFVDCGEVVT